MKVKELFPNVLSEDLNYEFKALLSQENPIKWAKTLVGFANGSGGIMFIGVSDDGEAFGLELNEIDNTKNLVSTINDRHIFPHVKVSYMMASVDEKAEHFVLAINVAPFESVVRYREGDFNEKVFIKGDGNTTPATPEDIISLSKRKYGVDNETTEMQYNEKDWTEYISLCRTYRRDGTAPTLKEMQNEEIVSKEGFAKSGLIMFSDFYDGDDTLICCRLWKGKNKTGVVLDSSRLKGSLAKVFMDAINFIERNTKTGWVKTTDGGREEIRSYPKEALREALVNAIAHRDYSILGTQIDVDIYSDRIEMVSPGSWLLPKDYYEYPEGSIPSIKRNSIISACLDVANLMERGGTGFQTMIESYKNCGTDIQPVISIYPGFLNLRLYDLLYEKDPIEIDLEELSDEEKVMALLKANGPMSVKELQEYFKYTNRGYFLEEILNPMIKTGKIYRDGKPKSPLSLIKLK